MVEFEDLWKFKPAEKLKIKVGGVEIFCPRYSTSYLNNYRFSGLDHAADMNVPPLVQRLMDWCNKEYNDPDINQALVNWYEEDGSIGKHSDDTRQLKANSSIYSFSFGPFVNKQFFLEPKDTNELQSYCVNLVHNTLLVMCGECQKTHYHRVPKTPPNGQDQRRVNVTFRCFE